MPVRLIAHHAFRAAAGRALGIVRVHPGSDVAATDWGRQIQLVAIRISNHFVRIAARIAMIAMMTRSSISVKADWGRPLSGEEFRMVLPYLSK